MQVIIFENNGGVSVVKRVDVSKTLAQIAERAVPQGVNYWIIEDTDVPTDRTFRDSWEIDETSLGIPSGQGGGA